VECFSTQCSSAFYIETAAPAKADPNATFCGISELHPSSPAPHAGRP
jgi:hypothetical protein